MIAWWWLIPAAIGGALFAFGVDAWLRSVPSEEKLWPAKRARKPS